MSFNKEFYNEKLAKLEQKRQGVLQNYINEGFKMVGEIQDLNERQKEISDIIKENEKPISKEVIEEEKELDKLHKK